MPSPGGLPWQPLVALTAIFAQTILGAAVRHQIVGVMPHIAGAAAATSSGNVGRPRNPHAAHGESQAPPSSDATAVANVFAGIPRHWRLHGARRDADAPQPMPTDGVVHGGACRRGVAGRSAVGLALAMLARPRCGIRWYTGEWCRRDARLHRIDEAADHLADPHEHGDRIFLRPPLARLAGYQPVLSLLLHTILGTGLIASGTAALNQWYEREADRKMRRTAGPPAAFGPPGRRPRPAVRDRSFDRRVSSDLWLGVNLLCGADRRCSRCASYLSSTRR